MRCLSNILFCTHSRDSSLEEALDKKRKAWKRFARVLYSFKVYKSFSISRSCLAPRWKLSFSRLCLSSRRLRNYETYSFPPVLANKLVSFRSKFAEGRFRISRSATQVLPILIVRFLYFPIYKIIFSHDFEYRSPDFKQSKENSLVIVLTRATLPCRIIQIWYWHTQFAWLQSSKSPCH